MAGIRSSPCRMKKGVREIIPPLKSVGAEGIIEIGLNKAAP